MPCCKTEDFKWCHDVPIVYSDSEGKEYCTFHAPKGKKGLSVEEFNSRVFERISDIKRVNALPCVSGNKINRVCDFSGTIFEGDIIFSQFKKENPLPWIRFLDAIFTGKADFRDVTFTGDEADFSYVTFNGEADFSFATFNAETFFTYAKFSQEANFSFATFNEESFFSWAEFREKANFSNAIFSREADFRGKTFDKGGDLIELSIKRKIRFEGTDFNKVSFLHTDLRSINFINPIWHKKYSRNLLYDEIKLFTKGNERDIESGLKHWFKKWKGIKKIISFNKQEITNVELLYRRLKQKYVEEHNQPEISNWHYGEKEMFRKNNLWRRLLPSVSTIYWLSSGYGERPVRAGIMLLMVIVIATVLFGFLGVEQLAFSKPIVIKEWSDFLYLDNIKDLLLATLQYATFDKNPDFVPKTTIGKYLKIFIQIFIPLQTALLALAIRNKFRR